MTHDQSIIANTATEFLRAMLMNPRVDPYLKQHSLPHLAVQLATNLHGELLRAFQLPMPNFLAVPKENQV